MSEQKPVAMPTTIEDAVQLAGVIPVDGETLLSWMRALAVIPTQYGADLYVSMKHVLAVAIEKVATAAEDA